MLDTLPDWFRLALELALPILIGTHALAAGAQKAADAYLEHALGTPDPGDDARARKIARRTMMVLRFLETVADNLPTIGRGVRGRR